MESSVLKQVEFRVYNTFEEDALYREKLRMN